MKASPFAVSPGPSLELYRVGTADVPVIVLDGFGRVDLAPDVGPNLRTGRFTANVRVDYFSLNARN